MSTSPLPPDPYEALGVTKDCDLDEIKKAHRKLVLKHHPDRIKDPALVEAGKNEFQKVQQAYELLIDPVRRERYNDQVKLAQLRKERMMSQPPSQFTRESSARDSQPRSPYAAPPSAYDSPRRPPMPQHARTTPAPQPMPVYEERMPDYAYDEPPRAHTRKAESHERRSSAPKMTEKSTTSKAKIPGWTREPVNVRTAATAVQGTFAFKRAAEAQAKKKVHETHARTAKARDQEERRERDSKQSYGRYNPHYDDYSSESTSSESDSSSDDDDEPVLKRGPNLRRDPSPLRNMARSARSPVRNGTRELPTRQNTREKSPARPIMRERSPSASKRPGMREREPTSKSQPHLTPEYSTKRQSSPVRPERRGMYFDDVEHESPDEHEKKYRASQEYQAAANSKSSRPSVSRQNSGLQAPYWSGPSPADHKRSGSDSDRQRERPAPVHKSSSTYRRSTPQEYEPHRPAMTSHTSAPGNIRGMENEQIPRSRQNSYDTRDLRSHRQGMAENMANNLPYHPPLQRSGSAPMPRPESKSTMPTRSSNLKPSNENNFDSGYGSGSPPHTPETGGESPPNERERSDRERSDRERSDRERRREPEKPATRPAPPKQQASSRTIYKAKKDDTDNTHRARKIADEHRKPIVEEVEEPLQRFLSPEDINVRPTEARERRNSKTREEEPRSRPTRLAERRPSATRTQSSSRYDVPSKHSRGRERSSERPPTSTRAVDMSRVNFTTAHKTTPKVNNYDPPSRSHHHSSSHHRPEPVQRKTLFNSILG